MHRWIGSLKSTTYKGKLFGGIYDDRFLVKPTKEALAFMPDAKRELPYPGAKEMLLVDEVDDIWMTFFAHECVGASVANSAGVARASMTGTLVEWEDGIGEQSIVG